MCCVSTTDVDALTEVAVQRYQPIRTKETTILISALLGNPENRATRYGRSLTYSIFPSQ
jgi:hypothetical protein